MLAAFDKDGSSPSSWSSSLRRIYFLKAEDAQATLPNGNNPFRELALGMERRVIPFIAKDIVDRRHRQLAFILQWQASPLINGDFKSEMIRKACSNVSRTSTLFARHLAQAQVGSLE